MSNNKNLQKDFHKKGYQIRLSAYNILRVSIKPKIFQIFFSRILKGLCTLVST